MKPKAIALGFIQQKVYSMNNNLKSTLIASALILAGLGAVAVAADVPLRKAMPRPSMASARLAAQPLVAKSFSTSHYAPFTAPAEGSALKADFSVSGQAEGNVTAWSVNFDNGSQGWTIDPTSYVTWTTKQIAASGDKSFSTIDPDDVKSLYVDGPYQTYRREISAATSPAFTVPDNGSLEAWVGYALNYDNYCRLIISISADDFATSTDIWNSGNPGDKTKTWCWHEVAVSLDAYAGQTVKLRFTYGPGTDDSFGTGGYMGDFAIDGIKINGKKSIDHIEVETGDVVEFIDITEGEVVSRHWNFPGANPSESTEKMPRVYYTDDGQYDVTLTVTDAEGLSSTVTRTAFVGVTGSAPVAVIGAPAEFRYSATGKFMVAPAVPVTFRDASKGFPTETHWMFGGTSEESNQIEEVEGKEATVVYYYRHDWPVGLVVGNRHGDSNAIGDVSVEFEGEASNLRADDEICVADVWDGEGIFPGSAPARYKITAYAERFSAPSAPVFIPGVNVYFVDAEAGELIDQIAPVSVSIYSVGPDGLPDRKLDTTESWSVFELDKPSATGLVPTQFKFSKNLVINEPFIVAVEGIPAFREATTDGENSVGRTYVSFATAKFRGEGGTSLWQKDGKWQEISEYFPAGKNHTSFMICPYVAHSVLTTNPIADSREITVGPAAGSVRKQLYCYYGGLEEPTVDADWLHVSRTETDMTVQNVLIDFDALPGGETERTGHIHFTDGASKMTWTVTQNANSAIAVVASGASESLKCSPAVFTDSFTVSGDADLVKVYDAEGRQIAGATLVDGATTIVATSWAPGLYIVSAPGLHSVKVVKK